jgi:hypothetical protein
MPASRQIPPQWTAALPQAPGYYEFFDPRHRVRAILEVRALRAGLAVRVPRGDGWLIPLIAWRRPCLRYSLWRGPIQVPDALPAESDG